MRRRVEILASHPNSRCSSALLRFFRARHSFGKPLFAARLKRRTDSHFSGVVVSEMQRGAINRSGGSSSQGLARPSLGYKPANHCTNAEAGIEPGRCISEAIAEAVERGRRRRAGREGRMTRDEFDNTRSLGELPCPDCGSRATHPRPFCGCPPNPNGYGTLHINKWHHTCPSKTITQAEGR